MSRWSILVFVLASLGLACGACHDSRSSTQQTYYQPTQSASPAYQYPAAENGSYYGEISPNTGRPKTVYVRPYTRSDGTWVQGHYRSAPRRR